MNFLNLLNPWCTKTPESVGLQQQSAVDRFEEEVKKSRLHYWRPGCLIQPVKLRILIGVTPAYALRDLRLLDVINKYGHLASTVVDVFNVDDYVNASSSMQYFPRDIDVQITPVVGVWRRGVFESITIGSAAIDVVCELLEIGMNSAQLSAGLCPPAPELMEDYTAEETFRPGQER